MSDWQPIETAPKDGKPMLRPHVIYGALAVRKTSGILITKLSGEKEIWTWVSSSYTPAWPDDAFLPYWQPLPEPPKEEK